MLYIWSYLYVVTAPYNNQAKFLFISEKTEVRRRSVICPRLHQHVPDLAGVEPNLSPVLSPGQQGCLRPKKDAVFRSSPSLSCPTCSRVDQENFTGAVSLHATRHLLWHPKSIFPSGSEPRCPLDLGVPPHPTQDLQRFSEASLSVSPTFQPKTSGAETVGPF